jgi:hypothetical protein
MAQFRKKPVVIGAITFDELVQHGRDNGANIVSGMPWSFQYQGCAVSHENDRHYLVNAPYGTTYRTLNVKPGDMLLSDANGELSALDADSFAATYEAA